MVILRIPFIGLVLSCVIVGQAKVQNESNIMNMATCKSTCKRGTCKQPSSADSVRCECNDGWRGERCDVPLVQDVFSMFRLSTPFPPPGTVDLADIDKRVSNREGKCADNFVCHNGGYCIGDAKKGYNCKCTALYTGTFCTELCEKKCLNGGKCIRQERLINGSNVVNKVCECPRQYQGEFCERYSWYR